MLPGGSLEWQPQWRVRVYNRARSGESFPSLSDRALKESESMARKRESKVDTALAKAVSRRQMLEGLGALAAVTACGSTSDGVTNGGAAGSPANPGGAGAANNIAGSPGAGAPGAGSPGAAGAGAGAPGAAGAGAGAPGTAGAPAGGAPGAAGAPAAGAPSAAGAGGMPSAGTLTSPGWTNVPVQDSSTA